MIRPRYLPKAETHLTSSDPILAAVMAKVGRCELRRHRDGFEALVDTVISQQIATKAAKAISARLRDGFPRTGLTPKAILRAGVDRLRACGLSGNKARTILAISERVLAGEIDLERMPRQSDEEIAEVLLPTPGIGPWSVHMYLMFGLARPDVLPTGDYGLRVAVRNCFGLSELPVAATIERIAEPWRPFRTVASWYLWQSLK
ncbi:MAG: DNA-3-methyladenine glycosylase family protein [Gemmataceae bacterium]